MIGEVYFLLSFSIILLFHEFTELGLKVLFQNKIHKVHVIHGLMAGEDKDALSKFIA